MISRATWWLFERAFIAMIVLLTIVRIVWWFAS